MIRNNPRQYSEKEQFVKSTIILTGSNVLTRVLSLIFFVILARAVSVEEYGLFRFLLSISMIYAVSFTGFTTALTHFIGKNKNNSTVYATNSLIVSFIMFIVVSIGIILFQKDKTLSLLVFFSALIDFYYIGFIAGVLNHVKLYLFKLLENALQLGILLLVMIISQKVNFDFAILFYSISGLLIVILLELWRPQFQIDLKQISKNALKEIASYGYKVAFGAIGWVILFSINTIFIKILIGEAQVGYYSVGATVVQIFTFIPSAISTLILPKVSSIKDKKNIFKFVNFAALGTIIVSMALLIFLLIFDRYIIITIFGEKYLPAVAAILALAIGQIAISVYQIYASAWQGLGKPSIPSTIIFICCILNIIGSYFLTKNFGIVGAATSSAITSTIAMVWLTIVFNKKWKIHSKE